MRKLITYFTFPLFILIPLYLFHWYFMVENTSVRTFTNEEKLTKSEALSEIVNPNVSEKTYWRDTYRIVQYDKSYIPFIFKKKELQRGIKYTSTEN